MIAAFAVAGWLECLRKWYELFVCLANILGVPTLLLGLLKQAQTRLCYGSTLASGLKPKKIGFILCWRRSLYENCENDFPYIFIYNMFASVIFKCAVILGFLFKTYKKVALHLCWRVFKEHKSVFFSFSAVALLFCVSIFFYFQFVVHFFFCFGLLLIKVI